MLANILQQKDQWSYLTLQIFLMPLPTSITASLSDKVTLVSFVPLHNIEWLLFSALGSLSIQVFWQIDAILQLKVKINVYDPISGSVKLSNFSRFGQELDGIVEHLTSLWRMDLLGFRISKQYKSEIKLYICLSLCLFFCSSVRPSVFTYIYMYVRPSSVHLCVTSV
jgi:hypothetical protein